LQFAMPVSLQALLMLVSLRTANAVPPRLVN
jgi:hypothetical protein